MLLPLSLFFFNKKGIVSGTFITLCIIYTFMVGHDLVVRIVREECGISCFTSFTSQQDKVLIAEGGVQFIASSSIHAQS